MPFMEKLNRGIELIVIVCRRPSYMLRERQPWYNLLFSRDDVELRVLGPIGIFDLRELRLVKSHTFLSDLQEFHLKFPSLGLRRGSFRFCGLRLSGCVCLRGAVGLVEWMFGGDGYHSIGTKKTSDRKRVPKSYRDEKEKRVNDVVGVVESVHCVRKKDLVSESRKRASI